MTQHPTLANPDLAPISPPDDRFIPVDPLDLIESLTDDSAVGSTEGLAEVAEALEQVLHQESHQFEKLLARSYNGFNPDNEYMSVAKPVDAKPVEATSGEANADEASGGEASGGEARSGERDAFLSRFTHLLDKANYERLGEAQIDLAIKASNSYGLRVKLNPNLIEHIEIWVRGRVQIDGVRRTARHPVRGESVKLDAFSRLAVIAQLKEESHVTLKLFRQIPIADVEALLPHAQVTMNWFDRVKVFGGGAGTIGATAMKVLGAVALGKLIWIVLVGFVVLSVRGVLGYRTTKQRRDSQRTQNLYYQNLANNAAVVHRLCASVEGEELKEAVLAYAICRADPSINTTEALAGAVQAYLVKSFGCHVDFDVEDALETMTRLNLWSDREAFCPLSPQQASQMLDDHWNQKRSRDYHESLLTRR